MGVNSLPKTVTRQRRDCDLNPGSSAPESSTLTTRLPSHPISVYESIIAGCFVHVTAGGSSGGVQSAKLVRRRYSHSVPGRAPCSTIAEVDHTTERSVSHVTLATLALLFV